MDYLKLKIVDFLFKYNLKIGQKLMYYQAKYRVDDMITTGKVDQRKLEGRFKKWIIYDQEILDRRRAECEKCEYKFGFNCRKCGCVISAKTKFKNQRCPVGKWEKEIILDRKIATPATT